jgi:beta-lactamase regulating signal transducer with metallopeptidase domain
MNAFDAIRQILASPTTPLWFSNLLCWSMQVALLMVPAAFFPRLFRIRQPRVLLLYWRTLLLISLALPLLEPWHHPRIIGAMLVESDSIPFVLPPHSAHVVSHWQLPDAELLAPALGLVILAGVLVRLLVFCLGLLKLRQFRQASRPIPASAEYLAVLDAVPALLNVRAELRLSADVDSPVTFGFARPVILLPQRFLSLAPRFQTAIACHELLHVRRRDWLHHLFEEILRAAFWFHPAIVWLIARIRLAREQVVDFEVVQLTSSRKTYLEALLQFVAGRPRAFVSAPPFLIERQLTERVSLMLKEVRMSVRRLIASVALMVCCLTLVVIVGMWIFPLHGAPMLAQAPNSGVTGGVSGGASGTVSGGISGGVAGGITGGIDGAVAKAQTGGEPNVNYDNIWTDTVKRGTLDRQVRGLGTLVPGETSAGPVAQVSLPAAMTVEVRPNQSAAVDTHKGVIKGHVVGVNAGSGDTNFVLVAVDGPLPAGVSVGASVDATIDIEKLNNVLYVGRPVRVTANSTASVFKIATDGNEAERVSVKFGRASVQTIEILGGLKEGDKIILSDMSGVGNADRVRLSNEKTSH